MKIGHGFPKSQCKIGKGINDKLKDHTFEPIHHIFVIVLRCNFRMTCDTNATHNDAIIWKFNVFERNLRQQV